MNERRLTPRKEYEHAYRLMRMHNGCVHDFYLRAIGDEILDCAVLSYDNRHEPFMGWRNKRRCYKWYSSPERPAHPDWTPF